MNQDPEFLELTIGALIMKQEVRKATQGQTTALLLLLKATQNRHGIDECFCFIRQIGDRKKERAAFRSFSAALIDCSCDQPLT